MKVRDVITAALRLLGRAELAEAVAAKVILTGEFAETVNTLLYCFNAVEDELARKYIPLNASETMVSPDGDFYYKGFEHSPVTVKRVICGGEDIKFEVFPLFLRAGVEKVTVVYEYAPAKKFIDGESDFGAEVGERRMALGAAAEYCLINGEVEAAEIWENKYRSEIDSVQNKLPVCGSLPRRRWV